MCFSRKMGEYLLQFMSGNHTTITTRKIICLPQSLPCSYQCFLAGTADLHSRFYPYCLSDPSLQRGQDFLPILESINLKLEICTKNKYKEKCYIYISTLMKSYVFISFCLVKMIMYSVFIHQNKYMMNRMSQIYEVIKLRASSKHEQNCSIAFYASWNVIKREKERLPKSKQDFKIKTRPGVDKVKPKGWFKYCLQID